jgi:hypothetical protein
MNWLVRRPVSMSAGRKHHLCNTDQGRNPEMSLDFGKHRGKLLETVVIKEPGYIHWMLSEDASGRMTRAQEKARRLIEIFDAKPLLYRCHNPDRDRTATYCSLYGDNLSPLWWCDACDPCSAGAPGYKLNLVKEYMHAVWHIRMHCGDREEGKRRLIRILAEAKGLPDRVTAKAVAEFFAFRPPASNPAS